MFKIIRHPEIIGAGVKYLSFVIISQMTTAYIIAAIINVCVIYLEVRMRNERLSQ
jgi:protein-S-isoprenylcysteine O-methyltransferase Ste14